MTFEASMNSLDILPFAAPILFAAMVSITSWLSYRRIMKKYPNVVAHKPTEQVRA
ncbi:hypothetical protein [Tardiphaga sp. OK245]|uniref:hypothetical protein n=1 Tax=Tardiphaga sp. OK245 TaxID=1855306 RepID=UPI0008A7C4D0|nr:hypothetical protein [Tardiphaga sp. OK245]SEI19800.1 hypothetical protein SAMN05216367_4959 [Tardiphaga sp. OK245]